MILLSLFFDRIAYIFLFFIDFVKKKKKKDNYGTSVYHLKVKKEINMTDQKELSLSNFFSKPSQVKQLTKCTRT